jgi:hypothetical protein
MKNVSALKTRATKKTTIDIPNHFKLLRKVVSPDLMALSSIAGDPEIRVAEVGTQPNQTRMPDGGLPKMFAGNSRMSESVAKAMTAQITNRSELQ